MGMTDCNRQGVRSISTGQRREAQQDPDHMLHLAFFRLTVPHYGALNFFGAVIINTQTVLHGRDHRRPPGLTQLERRTGIAGHEDVFHRSDLGTMKLNNLIDAIKDLIETMGKGELLRRLHHPAGDKGYPAGNNLDNTVAGNPGTRVNAKDADHDKIQRQKIKG